jgi:hypothetical protein
LDNSGGQYKEDQEGRGLHYQEVHVEKVNLKKKISIHFSSGVGHGATTFSITTFSIMTFSIMTFSIMTFSITTFSIMTFSITTFSIMPISLMTLCIMTLSIMGLVMTLSINDTPHRYSA